MIGCGLVLFTLSIQAQEKKTQAQEKKINGRFGVEMGFHEFFGKTVKPEQVRTLKSIDIGESSSYKYNDDAYMGNHNSENGFEKLHVGIKYEALFFKNRFGVATGIRFSQISSSLEHNRKYNYFIWMLRQDETTTDYLTIRSIYQKSHYFCIPLEIRFFPAKADRHVKQYFKIGGALNYRFSTKNDIDFHERGMAKHAEQIDAEIVTPCTFSGFISPAVGIRIGKNKKPWVSVEFQIPGFIIAERPHAFVRPDFGIGVQCSVMFPLNKTTH